MILCNCVYSLYRLRSNPERRMLNKTGIKLIRMIFLDNYYCQWNRIFIHRYSNRFLLLWQLLLSPNGMIGISHFCWTNKLGSFTWNRSKASSRNVVYWLYNTGRWIKSRKSAMLNKRHEFFNYLILCNRTFINVWVLKVPQLDLILSQLNLVHTLHTPILRYYIVILSSTCTRNMSLKQYFPPEVYWQWWCMYCLFPRCMLHVSHIS
jgi:hypothetical protein